MAEKQGDTSDDDELTIDFSGMKKKVKAFFKSLSSEGNEEKKGDDELSFDWKKIITVCKTHPTLILLVAVIFLQFMPNYGFLPWGGMWMRLQTQNLPLLDNWAENSVYNYYRNQVSNAITQQYPNLPDTNKATLVDEQLKQLLKGQEGEVQRQIEGTAAFLKEQFQYQENGRTYTYMPDIDPYFYLRRAENYLKTGMLGDTVKDNREWDTHQLAPIGVPVNRELHYYVLAYMHRIFSFFNSGIPPMQSAAYFPIVFMALAGIAAFLAGNRLAGNLGGVFAATLLFINTAAIGRTPWGHADTDAYTVLFPSLIIWLLAEAFYAPTRRKLVFFALATGASMGLYSFAWTGWWYSFDFILAAMAGYFVYLAYVAYQEKKEIMAVVTNEKIQSLVLFSVIFFCVTGILVSFFNAPYIFFNSFTSPLKFRIIKAAAHESLWPNVFTTVAELNPINVQGIIDIVGGKTVFTLALLGIVLLFGRSRKNPLLVLFALLFTVWLGGTMYAATKGVRFTLLIVPAVSIAYGVSVGLSAQVLKMNAKRHLHIPPQVTSVLTVLLFTLAIVFSNQVQAAQQNTRGELPIVNDAWWNALIAIRDHAPKDAIVNSWWDFGHHFKYFTDRGVTFDGGTQNSPIAHWIGHVLLTENEEEARGILRMLDCGSHDETWAALYPQTHNNTITAVNILYKLFTVHDREEARGILLQNNITNADAVLEKTHCDPPENYLIVSEDMIGKSGVWAHFGGWNFERAYIWLVLKNKPQDEAVQYMMDYFNYSKSDAERVYYDVKSIADEGSANGWISPWPSFQSGFTQCALRGKDRLECDSGIQVNLESHEVRINTPQGIGIPKKFVYIDEKTNELVKKEYNNSNLDLAIILVPRGGTYGVIIASPQLAMSMFTRLFFMEGHGLRYFTPFNSQQQIGGGSIFVYKTDWTRREPHVMSVLMPKTTVSPGSRVTIDYIGYLDDNTVFDSSIVDWGQKNVKPITGFDRQKTQPMTFIAGAEQTIKGFDDAVMGMNVSETKTFTVTPELGYGIDPDKHPLGNKTLHFKVRVESIR